MHILLQLGFLFGVCLSGEFISEVLPFPFPGSVISMLLLFVLFLTKVVKVQHTSSVVGFFQQNMSFFFLPVSVAIVQNLDLFKEIWVQFFAVCFLSTIITFIVTAWTVQCVIAIQKRIQSKHTKGTTK